MFVYSIYLFIYLLFIYSFIYLLTQFLYFLTQKIPYSAIARANVQKNGEINKCQNFTRTSTVLLIVGNFFHLTQDAGVILASCGHAEYIFEIQIH